VRRFYSVIFRKSSHFLTKRCQSCLPDQVYRQWRLQHFSNWWSNVMRREIRDFYDLKRQRVRRQRTEWDDKPINEMKISHMAQPTKCISAAKYSSSRAYPLTFLWSSCRRVKAVITTRVRMLFLHDIPWAEGTVSLQSLLILWIHRAYIFHDEFISQFKIPRQISADIPEFLS